ncbi:putative lipid II flippase MurJ [Spirochaetota bacterium]|nr:putative lipid II flippase MurJ [Spirochaetota bacterium]
MSLFTFKFKNIGEISFLTLISRILGQIRSTLLGALLSTSALADSFTIALKLPNFLRSLFSEGAASAVFIPMLSDAEANKTQKPPKQALPHPKTTPIPPHEHASITTQRMFTFLFTITLIAVVIVTVGGILLAPYITTLLYSQAQFPLTPPFLTKNALTTHTTMLMMIMFPYLITISLASLISALLYTRDRFKIATTLPIVFNVVFIIGILIAIRFYSSSEQAKLVATFVLSLSVIIGGILQLLLVVFALKKTGFAIKVDLRSLRKKRLAALAKLIAPVTGSSLFHQLQLLLLDPIALSLGAGGVTALFFSNRLLEFPLALLVYPVLTAAFPDLSRFASQAATDPFEQTFKKSLSLIILLTLFASLTALMVHESIVSLVFGFGAFKEESIVLTAQCLYYSLLGLPFIAINRLITQTLYSARRGRIVVLGAAFSLITSVGCSLLYTYLNPQIPMIALGATTATVLTTVLYIGIITTTSLPLFSFSILKELSKKFFYYLSFMVIPSISVFYLRKPIDLALTTLKDAHRHTLVIKCFELGDIMVTAFLLAFFILTLLVLGKDKETLAFIKKLRNDPNS